MKRRANEGGTHRGGVCGDDGWTIGFTDFLPPSSEFSCTTALNLGEMFAQLRFLLPNADTNKGDGADGRPLGLPFAPDLLRLLSLDGVLVLPLGQVRLILYLPFVVGIARNRFRRRA